MTGVSTSSKLAARYEYWHELPPTKHKFFKVMLDDFEYQLRFAHKFVQYFEGKLARECTLRGPSGNEWQFRIEKRDKGDIMMSTGWESFIKDHGVHIYDFLTFRYLGGSAFKVSIFTATGCQHEGAYFSTNGNFYTTCTSTLHSAENGGFDCLFESDEESDNSTSEGRLAEQNSESSSKGLNVRRPRGRESNKCNSNQKKGGNIDMSKSKANKKRVPSFEDLDMSRKEGEEDEATESSCREDILWHQFFRPNKRRVE